MTGRAERPDPRTALEPAARAACLQARRLGASPPRGAAILTSSGKIVAAPELPVDEAGATGGCAERVAIQRAILQGHRRFRAILAAGGASGRGDGGPPCGACLQVLLEFSPGAKVFWGTERRPRGGVAARDLLPGAFGCGHLPGASAGTPDRPASRTGARE